MIFKSRQVNLDPEPCVDQHGITRSPDGDPAGHDFDTRFHYAPRPEFEPTRDPEPWEALDGHRWPFEGDDTPPFVGYEWAPRREQFDTPVNRVLAFIRPDYPRIGAAEWLRTLDEHERIVVRDIGATPDEIEHARKVLMRLAGAA